MKTTHWTRKKNGARSRGGQRSPLHLKGQAFFPLVIVGSSLAALAACGRPDSGASPLLSVARPNQSDGGKAIGVPKAEDAALLHDILGETSALVRAHRSAYFWGRECLVTEPGQVLQRGFGVFKASALLDGFAGERAIAKGAGSVFRRLFKQEGRDLVCGPSGQVELRPTQLNGLEIQGEAATGRGLTVEDLASGDALRQKRTHLHTVWSQYFSQAMEGDTLVTRAQLKFTQERFRTQAEQRALVGTVAVEDGKNIIIREEGRIAVTDEPLEEADFEMVSVEETVIESGTLNIAGPRGRSFSVAFQDVSLGRDDGCPVPESGQLVVTLPSGRTITFGFEPDSVSIRRSGVLTGTRLARPEKVRQYPRSRFALESACDAGWDHSEDPKVKNGVHCADCEGGEEAPIEVQGEPPPEDSAQDVRVKISEADFYPEGLAIDARGNLYASSFATGAIARAGEGASDAEIWSAADSLPQSGLGMLVTSDQSLWACASDFSGTVPSTLRRFTLEGKLVAQFELPAGARPAFCNDLTEGRAGSLFVTDSTNGRVLVLHRGAAELVVFAEREEWQPARESLGLSLNGITWVPGRSALYVGRSDKNGLIEIPVLRNGLPGDALEFSQGVPGLIDGLKAHPSGYLVAVVNGGSLYALHPAEKGWSSHLLADGLNEATSVVLDARGNAWVAEGMLYTLFGLTGKPAVMPPFYLRHVLLPEAL